jgi:hypothetical protein
MNEIVKHCKKQFKVIIPYSDEGLIQVIEINGIEYKLEYLPRPCKNYSDLFCVYYQGVRFATLAKFLKTVS